MLAKDQVLQSRYCLQEILGQSTGKQTWLALDTQSKKQVVIKLLICTDQVQWDQLNLFEREAKVLKYLDHSQIPHYIDFFRLERQQLWFGMVQTYIRGVSLKQCLEMGQNFCEADVLRIAKEMLNILIYLHSLSPPILHRDIKPSNLLLFQNAIYLIDFGSVQDCMAREGATFTVVGTYGYTPLEQLGGRATPASDLYALGATLIHLVTGAAPAHLSQPTGQLQIADIVNLRPGLLRWLYQLTEANVEDRFSKASEALEALRRYEQAVSRAVGKKPRQSRIRILKLRQGLWFKMPGMWGIELSNYKFEIKKCQAFGRWHSEKKGLILEIEDIFILEHKSHFSLIIASDIQEYEFYCPTEAECQWLAQTLRQYLGIINTSLP